MPSLPDSSADVYFGPTNHLPDWRTEAEAHEDDSEAPEVESAPDDVIAILGFDPFEIRDEDQEDQSAV